MRFMAFLFGLLVVASLAIADGAKQAKEGIEVAIPNGPVLVFPPDTTDKEILGFIQREIDKGTIPSPPMPFYMGARFNAELAKIFHKDCTCYRLLIDGHVTEFAKPLSEKQRWDIMLAIRYKGAIPIVGQGVTH